MFQNTTSIFLFTSKMPVFFYTETLGKTMRYKLETPLIAKAKPFFVFLFYASDVSIKCGMYIIMLFI